MAKKKSIAPYFCTHCKSYHKKGEIYDEHLLYNARSVIQNKIDQNCEFVSEEIIVPEEALEIKALESDKIINKIDLIYKDLVNQIADGKVPYLEVPLRRRENIIYNAHNNYFLGKKTRKTMLGDKYNDFLRIIRISSLVKELLENDLHATKREIFYSDVNLFEDQKYSDISIEDFATLLGTYRDDLHIVANAKGTCIGSVKLRDRNDIIDLEALGSGGWTITSMLDNIEIIESDAEFILVVEKDAAMIRLAEDRFWNKVPCILITAKGSPDYATRVFLKKLVSELKIPAFGLADSDPYGLGILMTYAYGSVQSAHETSKFALNNFYWLGVMPKDLEEYKLEETCTLPTKNEDIRRVEYMLKEPPILNQKYLKEQLELILKLKRKAEIQALASHGFDFLIEYIINKIVTGDYIKF
ncbi:MAG: hypothetical protein ACFE9Z_08160 [Promethearchaeota archaeon]